MTTMNSQGAPAPAEAALDTAKPVEVTLELQELKAAKGTIRVRTPKAANGLELLTTREREVAKRLAAGARVKEIAAALGNAPKTVDCHKTRLMKKLDVHNRAQLTLWAVRVGLVKA